MNTPVDKASVLDVIVIGAGPAGLAAAIAAKRRGLRYVVIEKGALVNSLVHYPAGMVFFTTPELMEIGGLPFVSPHEKPTRLEALRYYRRVTDTYALDVRFDEPVTSLTRGSDDVFVVTSAPSRCEPVSRLATAVVLASGAYDFPNPLGVPGEDLPHVSHFFGEPHTGFRRNVVVVGGKNSAAETALELYRAGSRVTLVHRGETLGDSLKYWVKPDIENRIKDGTIAARMSTRVTRITADHVEVEGPTGAALLPADFVYLMTGYRADTALLDCVGAAVDAPLFAPVHDDETFETTVPNLFVIGACVAGKQSGKIFIENGRFHGEVAIRTIDERRLLQKT
ncbi:MAG: YpdA family putative bacillithiol disulfide reductase [Vicinamibacterales bacterium]